MSTATERNLRNTLKFETAGEVDSQEGWEITEGLPPATPNCSKVGASQEELNGTVGEALVHQHRLQCVRTKLIFDVVFDDPILD